MKSILCASLLIVLMPSAYAASLPGDSAEGKRLLDANCMKCHPDRHLHSQRPTGSVVGCAQRAVGCLQSCGKKGILRERNAGPPQILERSVLSPPVGPALVAPGGSGLRSGLAGVAARKVDVANVRFGSEADIMRTNANVRFSATSRHAVSPR